MTSAEYGAAWAIAASLWPDSPAARSERTQTAWRRSLERWDHAVLCRAFESLAGREPRLPSLATVMAACAELADAGRRAAVKIAAPEIRRGWEAPVDLPDGYVTGPCSALFAEMNGAGWTPERLAEFMGRAQATMAAAIEERRSAAARTHVRLTDVPSSSHTEHDADATIASQRPDRGCENDDAGTVGPPPSRGVPF